MRFFHIFLAILILAGCSKPSPNTLVVGTIAGPESELMEVAQKVAKEKYGLTIKIIEFNDYNLPNEALVDGSLDANIYQHEPYLKAAIKAHGYPIKAIGKTFVYPTAIDSKKIKNLAQIQNKALVAIPNDPSNEARALKLLEKAQLIKLDNTLQPNVNDISSNPKQLRFKEMDAAQLPRIMDDVDLAVINTNYAVPAGLNPAKDGLFEESKDSPYANLIVVADDTHKTEQLNLLVEALHSPEVVEKAKQLFGDAAIKAW